MAEKVIEHYPLDVTEDQIDAQAEALRKAGAKSVLIKRLDSGGWSVTTEWPSAEEKYREERFRKGG